jgi:pilus assembly protein CpaB
MTNRNKVMFALGLVVLVVGLLAVYLAVRDSGSGSSSSSSAAGANSEVIVAAKAIPAGTTGSDMVNGGYVKSKSVATSAEPTNAVTDASSLPGRVAQNAITEGQIITLDDVTPTQTRIGTVAIPPGKTAVAVQLANVPGVAGFAGAGDRIDVYAVVKTSATGGPLSKLLLQSVEVLKVNGTTLAPTQGQPGGSGLVFLLAVTPTEAEQLSYLSTFEQLYFSLVPKDQATVPPTPGFGPADITKA